MCGGRSYFAKVGKKGENFTINLNAISHIICTVVRDFKRFNTEILQLHGLLLFQITGRSVKFLRHAIATIDSFMNTGSSVNGDIQLFSQASYGFDVVGMVVSDKNRTYHIHFNSYFLQCLFYGTHSNTRINQYSIFLCTYIITISATATCQTYKFYFHLLNILNKEHLTNADISN